jgi:hypothetical protein
MMLIIWDLYDTGKYIIDNFPITKKENIGTRLARTSGNILQIDDNGNVSSILKIVESKLLSQKKKKIVSSHGSHVKLKEVEGKKPDGKPDKNHIIYYDEI